MLDFLFRDTPKHTVCRIALSDSLNFKIENKVIHEILKYLDYSVPCVDKCQLLDEYNSRDCFDTKISSMTSPILEYSKNGTKEIFSGFYPIIRFLGRLTHLFPSDIGNAAQIDTIVDFHSVFMNLYFNNPASTIVSLKNLMIDIDEEHMFLSSMDSCSIADILWATTLKEINIVSQSKELIGKINFYKRNILDDDEFNEQEGDDEYVTEDGEEDGDSDEWMEPTL